MSKSHLSHNHSCINYPNYLFTDYKTFNYSDLNSFLLLNGHYLDQNTKYCTKSYSNNSIVSINNFSTSIEKGFNYSENNLANNTENNSIILSNEIKFDKPQNLFDLQNIMLPISKEFLDRKNSPSSRLNYPINYKENYLNNSNNNNTTLCLSDLIDSEVSISNTSKISSVKISTKDIERRKSTKRKTEQDNNNLKNGESAENLFQLNSKKSNFTKKTNDTLSVKLSLLNQQINYNLNNLSQNSLTNKATLMTEFNYKNHQPVLLENYITNYQPPILSHKINLNFSSYLNIDNKIDEIANSNLFPFNPLTNRNIFDINLADNLFNHSPKITSNSIKNQKTTKFISQKVTEGVLERPKRIRVIDKKQRHAANLRERQRMDRLNEAFDILWQKISNQTFGHISKKLHNQIKFSRVFILRTAIDYIEQLTNILEGNDDN